ncbi:MAG TPA: tRNA pseudouridine(55) synthase TruB [Gammaproteobacteria bacterium]|nr:tRNA pseudouridine(55) synthase TruB [Gammaproteobacteria bacterium]
MEMSALQRPPKRPVHGILLLDKPAGISSNAALQRVRRALAAAKGGHTGNLDVAASGLLPLCFGEATKVSAFLLDADKTYVAELALGVTTSTGDREGEVRATRPVPALAADEIVRALAGFLGPQSQVPPMHSALKRAGRPLYAYARAGLEVERAPRAILIHALRLLDFAPPRLVIEVSCSKGTYVRTLAEDIGERLGCGAHLAGLRRTRAGPFALEDAHPLALFERDGPAERFDALLLPPDRALADRAPLILDAASCRAVCQGRRLPAPGGAQAGLYRLYGPDEDFLGIGEITVDGSLEPRRLMRIAAAASDSV